MMEKDFSVTGQAGEGILTFCLAGHLPHDADRRLAGEVEIKTATQPAATPLIFDLTHLESADSIGLGNLAIVLRALARKEKVVAAYGGPESITALLKEASDCEIFKWCGNREEALEYIQTASLRNKVK